MLTKVSSLVVAYQLKKGNDLRNVWNILVPLSKQVLKNALKYIKLQYSLLVKGD